MNNYLSPAELLASYSAAGVRKMERSAASLLLLGALAGAIIAIAAAATNTAVYGISDTWTVRTICGLLFPFGLGLVVVTGAELFTGNCMLPLTLLEKKGGSAVLMVRNWALVFAGNALGSLLVAWLCVSCGQLDYSAGALAVYTIRVGAAKCALPFGSALGLGVLCNLLVCLGVLAAASARETPGRLMGAFLPVCFFVLCGFEHSVANLYYIGPNGRRCPPVRLAGSSRGRRSGPSHPDRGRRQPGPRHPGQHPGGCRAGLAPLVLSLKAGRDSFMTGQEAIELIHQRAWTGRKPGLERTQALLASLGNPERRLRFVHITGTNGKGSTAAMTASILAQAGLRAGLFTSPHLYRFHERMQVNGAPIPDEVLGRLTQQVLEVAEGMSDPPTEFELMTAVGMEFFLEEQCDIVVLEVGLGGRLDSTNVIPAPEAAVITNIGLEHTQELGGTLTLIAREKSGILKPGCRAVLYRQSDEVTQVIQSVCRQLDIPLRQTDPQELEVLSSGLEGQDFRYRGRGPYRLSLLGSYQLSNAITALEVVQALRDAGWTIPEEAAVRGLAAAQWPGRLELARRSPDFIVDGGHNPQCVDALAAALESLYPGRKLIFLSGVLADKDWHSMFRRVLPLAKAFVAVTPDSPRALPAAELAAWLAQFSIPVSVQETLDQGVDTALALAGPEDVICAWGSLYSVGEIRHHLGMC